MTLATHHQLALAYHHAGRLMEAIRLYEKAGFRTVRQFAACVWEPARAI